MKIGFAGTGAMSLLFGGRFIESGNDVVFYNPNQSGITEILQGVTIDYLTALQSFKPSASTNPEILSDCEIIFFFVKSYSTGSAAREICGVLAPGSIVVTLQNGLDSHEILSSVFGKSRTVFGVTSCGAYRKSRKEITAGGRGPTLVGGFNEEAVININSLLNQAGIESNISDNPESSLWEKAVINSAINPLAAILNVPNGFLAEDPHTMPLMETLVMESVSAAEAAKIMLCPEDMLQKTLSVCKATSNNLCSMLQDIRSGRRTEIDSITGRILKTAAKHGLHLPCSSTVFLIIKSLQNKSFPDTTKN